MQETIVLANEDATFSQEVQTALEAAGYRVTPVVTGEAALLISQSALPNMLIVGTISDREPLSLLQQLQSQAVTQDIRFVWMPSSYSDEDIQRAWDTGVDGLIPFDPPGEEFARMIHFLFEGPSALEGAEPNS